MESPIDKTMVILFIRFKKVIYELYYSKFLYPILKPKIIGNKFIDLQDFKLNFISSLECLNIEISNDFLRGILENQFTCLGYGQVDFSNSQAWNSDLIHKYQWSYKYFNKIDYVKRNIRCDVKIPWEINRLQFLTVISLQYLKTKDENLLTQYERVIDSWICINKPGYGIPWTCNMEVSIRVINLITSFIILYDDLSDILKQKIKFSILEHYKYIKSFPEISDVPGNHYLSNLTAKYFCTYFIYGNSHSITKSAYQDFLIECSNQFDDDGGHFEHATIYHRLCLDFVAITLALSSRAKFNEELFNIYSKGIEFCNKISSNFILPIIGDSDSGNLFWFGNDCRNYKYLNDYCRFLNGENLTNITQECKILIAFNGTNYTKQKKQNSNLESFYGNISGLSVNNSENFTLIMRYGDQGMNGRASHDHDDAQNITLLKDGKDILIDEGCKSYSLDPEVRKKDILSSGHNGIKLLEQERYFIQEGSVINSIKGAFTCHETIINHNSFHSHLKTKNNNQFKELNREIFFEGKKVFEVFDSWKCYNVQNLELNWRFNSIKIDELKDEKKSDQITFTVTNQHNIILVVISSDCKIEFETFSFDYGFIYGTSRKSKGLKILILNSKEGNIKTRFEILK